MKQSAYNVAVGAWWLAWVLSALVVGIFFFSSLIDLWRDHSVFVAVVPSTSSPYVTAEAGDTFSAIGVGDLRLILDSAAAERLVTDDFPAAGAAEYQSYNSMYGWGIAVPLPSTDTAAKLVTGAAVVFALGIWRLKKGAWARVFGK